MTENDDVPGSPDRDVTPPEQPAAMGEPAAAAPVLKTRWRDRAWSFRAMLAVALATLVIGGVGGGVIGAVISQHDRHHGFYRMGPGGGPGMGPGMGPGWREHRWGWNGGGPGWNQGPQQRSPYDGATPAPSTPAPSTPSPTPPGSTG